jgi:hypothetical protein
MMLVGTHPRSAEGILVAASEERAQPRFEADKGK